MTDVELGFMQVSKAAIRYWIDKLNIPISWDTSILEGDMEFYEWAFLFFNPKYQISMDSTRLQVVKRNELNQLTPYDSPEVKFLILEHE